jgi:RNA-directed DNA polymerase
MKRTYTKAKMLISMGVLEYQAWIFALSGKGLWRMSAAPQLHSAMNNNWFKAQGLLSLERQYLSF